MTVLVVLEGVVILILAILVVGLLRSHAAILRQLHHLGLDEEHGAAREPALRVRDEIAQPRAGTIEAADIMGVKPGGGAGKVTVVGPQSTLLAFLSSGCTVCAGFWDAFASRDALPLEDTRLVIVTKGPHEESESAIAALAPSHHQLLMSSEAWEAYDVPVSPYFVLVEGSGRAIGEGAAVNWAQLSKLMREAVADAQEARGHRARNDRIDRELREAGLTADDPTVWSQPGSGKEA